MPLASSLRPITLGLSLAFSLVACGSSDSTGADGAQQTGNEPDGAAGDADAGTTPDAPSSDATTADASDGGGCAQSLAAACANAEGPGMFGVSCADTWDLAVADTHYCGSMIMESQADCGAYRARIAVNVDFSYTYYYDAATGALVAVFSDGLVNGVQCVGGPASFVLPTCAAPQPMAHCGDGGGDAAAD